MLILGINRGHADASAALVANGKLVAACQEERFNRVKHSAGFPEQAIAACLGMAGVPASALDHVALASKPIAHVEDDILFALAGRSTFAAQLRERLERVASVPNIRLELERRLGLPSGAVGARVHEIEHHTAGLATAFLPHGDAAEGAAALSLGTFGDFASTVFGRIEQGGVRILGKVLYPHSLGILYTMMCQFLGLGSFGNEGKVMGLAGHGQPTMRDRIDQLFQWRPDGTFSLNLDFFTHHLRGIDMTWDTPSPTVEKVFNDRMVATFGPPRRLGEPFTQVHRDIAASLQAAVNDWVVELAARLASETGSRTLYLAGMLAESAVLASTVREKSGFDVVEVPYAAGDAGTAIGAAFTVHRQVTKQAPAPSHPFTGPAYSDREIEASLIASGSAYEYCREPAELGAALLASGKIIGWFQGAMEFGPRALGNRSILADPRQASMRDVLNTRVKLREVFLPFAASVLAEHAGDLLRDPAPSPWMQFVGHLRDDAATALPAVTHVDGTVRYQTVPKDSPSALAPLLLRFHALTGCPALVNTSLNENGPIVRTPEEAITCFASTGMDALFIGSFVLRKPPAPG